MSETPLDIAPPVRASGARSRSRLSGGGKARRLSRRQSAVRRAAVALFGVHLMAAPMLLGGIFPWTMTLTAASSLVSLAAVAYACDVLDRRAPNLLWVALLMLGWTALQAVPLPIGLAETLAPQAAANASAVARALGKPPPSWVALSRDPGATQQEIVKGVAIVASLLAAWLIAVNRGRREVFWLVALSTLAMSLVALAHGILRLDRVFGVYNPLGVNRAVLLAPLMNANNLAGFTAIGVPLFIGLTHRHESLEVRWFGRIATVITFATALLALSRGAIVQVCLSVLVMLVAIYLTRRRGKNSATAPKVWPRLGLIASLAIGAAFVAFVGGSQVATQFQDRDLTKLTQIARAFEFVGEHPLLGIGRGAFSSAFVGVEGRTVRFVHAENFIAHWLNEWGVPFTLLWLACVAVALWQALRGTTALARLGAATALLGFCGQNLADFGFELVGVAVVAAALLGGLIVSDHETVPADSRLASAGALACIALGLGAITLALLGPLLPSQSIASIEARLRSSMQQNDRSSFRASLERGVELHPSEPRFAIIAATEGLKNADPKTPRWLNRAMQVAPQWAAPHLLAYQWLWAQGLRSQALLEFRRAAEADADGSLTRDQACVLARQRGEWLLGAAPKGLLRRPFLEAAANCVATQQRSSEVIDSALRREFPDSPVGHEREAYRLAQQGHIDQSLEAFARLLRDHPQLDSARVGRAEILLAAGRLEETVKTVDADLPRVQEHNRQHLLRRQTHAYARLRDEVNVERSLKAFRRLTAGTADGLAESYSLEGYVQLEMRHNGAAFGAFREAFRINQDTQYLKIVAQLANRFSDRPQELWAYIQLCEREPLDPNNCARRDRLLRPASSPEPRR